jgi:phosphatidylglycerophosphate synthase
VSDTVRDAPEGSSMAYSLEEIRVLAKREPFRAGVRMRYLMPRVSVRVTHWILHHLPNVTPNQLTLVSAVLGVAAGAFLLFPRGIAPAVAALLLYQLHILFDYVDGEIARVKQLASPLGAYYDLMVGRLVKPVVIYGAVIGTWLGTKDPTDAPRDLLLGTLILLGFFLDKEAVDVWYRANAGRTDLEDPYVVRSDRPVRGLRRRVARVLVGLRGIQTLLVYQVLAAVVTTLGVRTVHLGGIETTPRGVVLMAYAVAFPAVALIRTVIIARTGHIPRRQDLVGG